MQRRIFISSVMKDFASQRSAAKEAVLLLRQISSQTACHEGVRTSDVYVGIFGTRYGYVARTSGLAATEEEFNEARRLGLPVLCFEQKGSKEPPQATFLQRIKDYENGYAVVSFGTADELKMAVVQAIHDHIGQPGITALAPAAARTAMDRHKWGSPRYHQNNTWLGAVLLPARQGERFLDVLEFSQRQRQDSLLQPALFGSGSLFETELGVQRAEAGDALVFSQGDDKRSPLAILEIHADATLVFRSALRRHETTDFASVGKNFFMDFVIDEDDVERLLGAFASYAGRFYQNLDRGNLISSLFFGTSLTGIANKIFGKSPTSPQNSFTMPSNALPDPLNVPDSPLPVSRADLSNAATLARKMKEHIARMFRNANAYGTAGQASQRRLPW
jgi:Domain of unknown function (DUF4062)